MNGVHPCARASSPVSSSTRGLSQPSTLAPPPPLEVQSVLSASSAKITWCVGKQVEINVQLAFAGSYIERWRAALSIGATCADGCEDPFRHHFGFAGGRMRAAAQTRPFASIIWLCVLVWLSQIGSAPQYGEGAMVSVRCEGVFGSRTGCFTSLVTCFTGSSTGQRSVLFSGAP